MTRATATFNAHRASGVVLLLAIGLPAAQAQEAVHRQPPDVPTVVALSMMFGIGPFGHPRFFVGETPTGWPSALVPPGAKVIGGSVVGDSVMFRVRAAVFDLGTTADPTGVMLDLAKRAGFAERPQRASSGGGFVATEGSAGANPSCRGSTIAMFGMVDSLASPGVVAVHLVDGEAGVQNCTDRPDRTTMVTSLITIPTMSPPPGGVLYPAGSSTSGEAGTIRASLRSTMPADSVLAHFTTQLVAGGWRADARAAVTDGAGVQRFLIREGEADWVAALFIVMLRDQYQLRLEYARRM